jgi:hypothetical protein
MAEQIIDGSGNGYRAKVDENKRLHTQSVTASQLTLAVLNGDAYNVSTGTMNLTSANESAVGYFKYNGDTPLVISEILVILGASTGGSGSGVIKILSNPTAGTLIDNADPVPTAANRDFGSSKTLDADAYKGAEGYTLTDGDNFAITSRDASFNGVVSFDAAPIVLRKGSSIGITFTPSTGNTSQTVVVAGTVFVDSAKLES